MYARHRPSGPRGQTVLKNGSVYTTVDSPTVDQINAATIAYLGGHIYIVTTAEAAALNAAGYTTLPDPPDTIAPFLLIEAPAHDSIVVENFLIKLSYELNAVIDARLISGNTVMAVFSWPFNDTALQVNSMDYPDGVYRLQITATDAFGNSTRNHIDLFFQNTPIYPALDLYPSESLYP